MDAVRIESSIAQPAVIAGEPFSIITTITNLHEEPIDLIVLRYHVPFQIQWISDKEFETAYEAASKSGVWRRFTSRAAHALAAQPPGTVMNYQSLDLQEPFATIAPGQSFVYTFKAFVKGWLFSGNGRLNFKGSVHYRTRRGDQTSVFDISFAMRPPLRANMTGAVAGAILGSVAQRLRDQGGGFFISAGLGELSAVALAIILSIVAVVYASRRGGEGQPILTIEDIWGGLIVGFLMGYLGHSFFFEVVPVAQPDAGA
jgi:hypothetical protein